MFVCGEVRLSPLALIRAWTVCLIANPQQVFPPAKLTLEAQALSDLKCSDDAPLDLLASLSKWKESLRLRSRLGEETNTSHL
jgi:hypothetical protein